MRLFMFCSCPKPVKCIMIHDIYHCVKCNNVVKEENKPIIRRIISPTTRYKVLKAQGFRCNECGVKLKYSCNHNFEGEVAHIDHIHPFSQRKTYPNREQNINELSNLQALCPSCNKNKGKKEIN